MSQALSNLLALLNLEKIEEGLFRGQSEDLGLRQVFGGQVVGQALYAAKETVSADRLVHSFHSYFLRPGDSQKPIVYDVEILRDGNSFRIGWGPYQLHPGTHDACCGCFLPDLTEFTS